MADPVKDQVEEPKHGPKQSQFDEKYDAGWKAVEEMTAAEKTAGEKKTAPAVEEDDCPGCDQAEKDRRKAEKAKKTQAGDKKPYKMLKVGGKDLPVYSKQELVEKIVELYGDDDNLIDLGQMSADYTRKTQALATERKEAEALVKTKADGLEAKASEVNKLIEKLERDGLLSKATTKEERAEQIEEVAGGPADKAEIYKEFDIDPAYAEGPQKKMVEAIFQMRESLEKVNEFVDQATNERIQGVFDKVIAEERKKFPYDDIANDQGQSLTDMQLRAIVQGKRQALGLPEGTTPTMEQAIQIVRDSVKEVHLLQKKSKDTAVENFSDSMTEDDFIAKHPELAARLKTKFGGDAVVESEVKKSKVPPSLTSVAKGSETKPPKAEKRKSFADYLEAGFKDPETIKAIEGA
jgi:hypothetical protein